MKTETKTTKVRSAFGKELDKPIPFSFTWPTYETNEEFLAARAELSTDEQRKARNNISKAKARAAQQTIALKAAGIVEPTLKNDKQLRLQTVYDAYVANGMAKETAKDTASKILGIEWEGEPDEDDEDDE